MILTDGYGDVPPGKIAAVVTSLEMFAPAAPRTDARRGDEVSDAAAAANRWDLRHVERPEPDWYRDLFKRVGEPWLWFSRLMMSTPELTSIIHDPHVDVFALWAGDRAEGLLELDFRVEDECELSFFGVTPPMIGSGAGRVMMNHAIARAWSHPTRKIRRLWLHTCSLDHPGALSFYLRSGFVAYRRQIEIADDPRLTGRAARTAAPHVPIITPDQRSAT
jgi:GNAT superfamily N-acetyltransferase